MVDVYGGKNRRGSFSGNPGGALSGREPVLAGGRVPIDCCNIFSEKSAPAPAKPEPALTDGRGFIDCCETPFDTLEPVTEAETVVSDGIGPIGSRSCRLVGGEAAVVDRRDPKDSYETLSEKPGGALAEPKSALAPFPESGCISFDARRG